MADLLLSKLKEDTTITKGQPGKWESKGDVAFRDVAESLDYQAPGAMKSVSSVPTMWARPLITEMALYDTKHPIHKVMVDQWRGMIAAIALAEVEGFDLKAQFLDLSQYRYQPFGDALYQLMPEPVNALYTRDNKNPWEEIYVFLWKGKPVGMSSPSTLVCPSEEGNWNGLRWYQNGMLVSPEPYLNQESKELLWRWLENLQAQIVNYQGSGTALNRMIGLISQFRNDLRINEEGLNPLQLSSNPTYFGEPINRGALILLNQPLKIPPKPSNVRVIPSAVKTAQKPLIVIDENIAEYWGVAPQNIWIHRDKTLASLNINDLKNGTLVWDDVNWIASSDLFLEELAFVDLEGAFPGAIAPKSQLPITFNGNKISPLLPLNEILLEYFTPEDLLKNIELEPFVNVNGQGIRLTLTIPLSGIGEGNQRQFNSLRLQKDYILKEENAIKYVPVLTVWPNFRAKNWKTYYTFYYDGDYGDETFQVYFPNPTQQPRSFKDPNGTGAYQLSTLEQMPTHVICKNSYGHDIGLILLPTVPEINSRGTWRVGVDFGTSFTNVYVRGDNTGDSLLDINRDLQLNVTESPLGTRLPALIENFIPDTFLPSEEPLPLCTVLTTKNSDRNVDELQPILDGRIYIPDPAEFDPNKQWIRLDLKWSNIKDSKAFLRHLALHISAIAASEGMDAIQWCVSYPSAFSYINKMTFHRNWQDIATELQPKTGIDYSTPQIDDNQRFCTESVALAQYFNDKERHPLVRTTCIDIGGGTSDISIWENRRIVYQCSVLLAGRNIFSEVLAQNPRYAEKLMQEFISGNWGSTSEMSIMTKIDVCLRHKAQEWLNNKRVYKNEDPYFQRLITITAIGVAGLYYYVGLILKTLHQEGKYSQAQITPVYVGGNASRFFHWLSPTGKYDKNADFNKLLSYILSKASEFNDTQEQTVLSERPKHEVACGLVLNGAELTGLTDNTEIDPIAGEKYYVEYQEDDQIFKEEKDWQSRLHLEGTITKFDIPELTHLEKFLYEFHAGLQSLKIQTIQPLPKSDYKPQKPNNSNGENSEQSEDKNAQLWKEVKYHLENQLLDIKGDAKMIREKTPFIMGLKSLLHVLGRRWADAYRD